MRRAAWQSGLPGSACRLLLGPQVAVSEAGGAHQVIGSDSLWGWLLHAVRTATIWFISCMDDQSACARSLNPMHGPCCCPQAGQASGRLPCSSSWPKLQPNRTAATATLSGASAPGPAAQARHAQQPGPTPAQRQEQQQREAVVPAEVVAEVASRHLGIAVLPDRITAACEQFINSGCCMNPVRPFSAPSKARP